MNDYNKIIIEGELEKTKDIFLNCQDCEEAIDCFICFE